MLEPVLFSACLALSALALFRLRAPPAEASTVESDHAAHTQAPHAPATNSHWLPTYTTRPGFTLGLCMVFMLSALTCMEFLPGHGSVLGVVAIGLCVLTVSLKRELVSRRTYRLEQQLLDAIDLMNAALSGGLPPRQSLMAAADAAKGDLGGELHEILDRLHLGMTEEDSVRRLRQHFDCEGVRLFTQAIVAKWHSAHQFAALLKNVAELLRQRLKLRNTVRSQLSGARYAAVFCGLLPYLLVPFFLWKQPEWLDTLRAHPHGLAFVAAAMLMQGVGLVWLRRILRIEL